MSALADMWPLGVAALLVAAAALWDRRRDRLARGRHQATVHLDELAWQRARGRCRP